MINKSNAELCASLNFSFDEANELFSNESLTSMQSARVNGGAEKDNPWLLVLIPLITEVVKQGMQLLVKYIESLMEKKNGTVKPTGPTVPSDLKSIEQTSDGIKLSYSDGTMQAYLAHELIHLAGGTMAP